jgi:hypothetical protein
MNRVRVGVGLGPRAPAPARCAARPGTGAAASARTDSTRCRARASLARSAGPCQRAAAHRRRPPPSRAGKAAGAGRARHGRTTGRQGSGRQAPPAALEPSRRARQPLSGGRRRTGARVQRRGAGVQRRGAGVQRRARGRARRRAAGQAGVVGRGPRQRLPALLHRQLVALHRHRLILRLQLQAHVRVGRADDAARVAAAGAPAGAASAAAGAAAARSYSRAPALRPLPPVRGAALGPVDCAIGALAVAGRARLTELASAREETWCPQEWSPLRLQWGQSSPCSCWSLSRVDPALLCNLSDQTPPGPAPGPGPHRKGPLLMVTLVPRGMPPSRPPPRPLKPGAPPRALKPPPPKPPPAGPPARGDASTLAPAPKLLRAQRGRQRAPAAAMQGGSLRPVQRGRQQCFKQHVAGCSQIGHARLESCSCFRCSALTTHSLPSRDGPS